MTVARWQDPDYTSMLGATYKAALDAAHKVGKRFADAFAPHQVYAGSPNPDRAVELDAGFIWNAETLTEVSAQTVTGFTTPTAGTERIDRVVVDAVTGVASRVAGTPQSTGSPGASAPAIASGKIPICQVLMTSADTVVTNSMITDERAEVRGFVAATQAEMEAGTSLLVPVTPGRQHYHPSAAKTWCAFDASANAVASYNVTSVTDNGTGDWTVNIGTDFSSDNYAPFACGGLIAGVMALAYNTITSTAGACQVQARRTDSAALADPTGENAIYFSGFGDQ